MATLATRRENFEAARRLNPAEQRGRGRCNSSVAVGHATFVGRNCRWSSEIAALRHKHPAAPLYLHRWLTSPARLSPVARPCPCFLYAYI